MGKLFVHLCRATCMLSLPLFLAPVLISAQTDNTVDVKNFSGATVGDKAAAAQATCNPSLTCIVVFDPSLGNVSEGILPTPCPTCIWEDYRVPGTFSITGNFYVNGTQIGPSNSGGGSSGGSGGGESILSAPSFTPPAGAYTTAQNVAISGPAGATVCYTVDGSTPASSTAGTCSHGSSYSSPIPVAASETISALATESGWMNSSVASAAYTFNAGSYADSFLRANGTLGPNWSEPDGAGCPLQILSSEVYATCTEVFHPAAIYTAGTFANNQYSSFVVAGGTPGGQAAYLRGRTDVRQFYNDSVSIGNNGWDVGNANSVDFCQGGTVLQAYRAGDTHELAVAGTNPAFIWSFRNGSVDGMCVDTANNYSGGYPGLGMSDDPNSSPTLADGAWTGGSLPNFSSTPSDNFQRANAGWLGVNWLLVPVQQSTTPAYFEVLNNAAVLNTTASNGSGYALWTTPFNVNQSSTVTIGNLTSGDWIAAIGRYTISSGYSSQVSSCYLALYWQGTVYLFQFNGSYSVLTTASYPNTPSTIELDAAGTSPVVLTVKVNGSTLIIYSDSTYKYTGTYAGFGASGHSTSTITGWTGGDL